MFGFLRRKPPKLAPFAEAKPRTFTPLLCDGLTAHPLPGFADLLSLHARLQREHSDVHVLASLDDLGQALYTSGHGIDLHGLDDVEGHDLSALDPQVFEDGEHQGYLSTPAEFPIRLANLLERARDVQIDQISGLLEWETPGDANDLVTINKNPEAALGIGRDEVLFQFVPVATAAEAIAAFPNGYFQSDLDPMQNYALARHLETRYGLALFGVGSRMLGFRRQVVLDEDTARALAADLAGLYANAPAEATESLTRVLAGRSWLLIRYTES